MFRTALRARVAKQNRRSTVLGSFNQDGVEIARVRSGRRREFPVLQFFVFAYLVLLIRLVTLAEIGHGEYHSRMAELREGNFLERLAGVVMELDPVSRMLAAELRKILSLVSSFL